MSAIVVVRIEGVLAQRGVRLPIAQPIWTGVKLVRALTHEFTSVSYLTDSDPRMVDAWLKDHGIPPWQWLERAADGVDRAEVVARMMAQRVDRCALYVDSDDNAFAAMSKLLVPVVLFHAEHWERGDFRPPSTWVNPDEEEDAT